MTYITALSRRLLSGLARSTTSAKLSLSDVTRYRWCKTSRG
nr:MAG TPA: hypothetical protein [Bacteriophage sp.]